MFQMPFHIEISSYATAILFTFSFVLFANLAVRKKILTLDLVEVLKERE
jgi:ABC-type antimicrobial peptide transport system permease subunit